jgi:hypothetical protein
MAKAPDIAAEPARATTFLWLSAIMIAVLPLLDATLARS